MLRRTKDPAAESAAAAPLRRVRDREDVRAATQALAAATARLTEAEQALAAAHGAVETAERDAGATWDPGAELPGALAGAHERRSTAESRVRVARHAVDAAREASQRVLGRAHAEFREELAVRERVAVAELDAALLEAGRLTVALVALHQAAHETFGSGHGSGVWSKAFLPLAPAGWHGDMPGSVALWRKQLRAAGLLDGDDRDWVALCASVGAPPMPPPEIRTSRA